jgi:hypothetical protein
VVQDCGFNLHAKTHAGAVDDDARARLLRYVLRPPLACYESGKSSRRLDAGPGSWMRQFTFFATTARGLCHWWWNQLPRPKTGEIDRRKDPRVRTNGNRRHQMCKRKTLILMTALGGCSWSADDPPRKKTEKTMTTDRIRNLRLLDTPLGRAHRSYRWLCMALGSLAICVALAAVPSTAQAQAEQTFINPQGNLCITGWIKIAEQDTDKGPLAIRAVGQMHTYTSCPTTLGEGGGDASSAQRLNVTPSTLIAIWYWDFGTASWVQCADGGWHTDDIAWSSANYLIVNPECPHQAWLGMTMGAYASLDNGATWVGSHTWSGYYWHN